MTTSSYEALLRAVQNYDDLSNVTNRRKRVTVTSTTNADGETKETVRVTSSFNLDVLEQTIQPVRYNLSQVPKPKKLKSARKVLIIPDTQHGFYYDSTGALNTFHDERALHLSLEVSSLIKPDQVVFLGDHCDFPDLSLKYLASPEAKGHIQKTLDAVASFIALHRQIVPNAQFDYLDSNHAKRLTTAILTLIPALHNIRAANKPNTYPLLSEPYLLGFDELKVNYHGGYPNEIVWLNEQLACVHGYIAKQKSSATSTALLSRPYSTITGHIHKQELVYATEWTKQGNRVKYAGCPGTLSKIDSSVPSDKPYHNWQQGLFIIHILNDTESYVEPVLIDKGKCYLRGLVLKA